MCVDVCLHACGLVCKDVRERERVDKREERERKEERWEREHRREREERVREHVCLSMLWAGINLGCYFSDIVLVCFLLRSGFVHQELGSKL